MAGGSRNSARTHLVIAGADGARSGDAMPFAVDLYSAPRNYDSGGMSIEGAKPALGHLGVILYGEAAVNDVRMETGKSLFATLAAIDPSWAIVEYNTADLRNPAARPTYAAAYRGLRDLWNFGARYMSPMAWNGSNGAFAGQSGYSTFTAWRNTPLEEAARDFMLARAGLPLGALLWTFGTPLHADGDGWNAGAGLAGARTRIRDAHSRRATTASRCCHRKGFLRQSRAAEEFVLGLDATAGLAARACTGESGPRRWMGNAGRRVRCCAAHDRCRRGAQAQPTASRRGSPSISCASR